MSAGADTAGLYQRALVERSRRPLHAGRPEHFDAEAHRDNPLCGDRITVFIRLGADGTVAEARFEARGCAVFLASADLMAEAVTGLARDEAGRTCAGFLGFAHGMDAELPAAALLAPLAGVREYPGRISCATMPWEALAAALAEGRQAA